MKYIHGYIYARSSYGCMFVTKSLIVKAITCVYHIVFNMLMKNHINILQLFIMDGLVLCVSLKYHTAHILFGWTIPHCIYVPIFLTKF